jgi:hypothetical protein
MIIRNGLRHSHHRITVLSKVLVSRAEGVSAQDAEMTAEAIISKRNNRFFRYNKLSIRFSGLNLLLCKTTGFIVAVWVVLPPNLSFSDAFWWGVT